MDPLAQGIKFALAPPAEDPANVYLTAACCDADPPL